MPDPLPPPPPGLWTPMPTTPPLPVAPGRTDRAARTLAAFEASLTQCITDLEAQIQHVRRGMEGSDGGPR